MALPIKNEYLPIFIDMLFPIKKPNKVKSKLTIEKVDTTKKILLYKYVIPIPIDKLSKLTEKAKNIIPIRFRVRIFLSFSKKLINISIDNSKNTKNIIIFGLKIVLTNKFVPIKLPIKGIKK